MKHQTRQEMEAAVTTCPIPSHMSQHERVERWAALLEMHGGFLNPLMQIEYLSPQERRAYRGTNTPLTVAFSDPVLREQGLKSDGLGDAMDFFGMSDSDAHRLLCDCRYFGRMTGGAVADRLRRYAARKRSRANFKQAIWRFFGATA
ncbi:hypothetical protein [Nitratireductor sp. GCM10026969]|uniref:hypothetical protein n=1 Tax=Nitratireductor sp. GCM10026969 TaxID=3252645 RepID=UPI00360757A0